MPHRKKPGTVHNTEADKAHTLDKVEELLKSLKAGMLTTQNEDHGMHSRPMMVQEFDKKNQELWFFTGKSTGKTSDIQNDNNVCISFSNYDSNSYLCITGIAELINDSEKAAQLWNPMLKAWFPEGLEDPNLILIKVKMHSAEYWDSTSSALVQLVGFAKAILTGEAYEASKSENQRVHLN